MNNESKSVIEIKPLQLKNLVSDYYKELYKDNSVSVIIESGRNFVGIYESQVLYTILKLKRKLKIKGLEVIIEEKIDDNQIKEILNQALDGNNYEVEKLDFQTKCKLVGVYEDEEVYFKGLNVCVKPKQKVKQKVKQKNL